MPVTEDLRQRGEQTPGGGTTVTQRLVTALRSRILSGDLEPGSRIVVDDIRHRYNVSHIPVREALRSLEGEGLIRNVPNHGARVTELSPDEFDGLYDLRLILETALIARSCATKSTSDIDRAEQALDAMSRLDPVADPVAFQDAHRDFHAALVLPATTTVSRRTLEPVWQAVQRYLVRMYQHPVVAPRGVVEHKQIFDAWAAGDTACVELLRHHLSGGREQIAESLAQQAADAD